MNVLILANNDWAGVGTLLTESLCRVGINAKFYSTKSNIYKHPSKSINKAEAIKFSQTCDIIQYMHSEKVPLNIDLKNKKVVVFHGGGKFRVNYKKVCSIFNDIVDCSLIQTYDLFGLGAKNEQWLLPPIDVNKLTPSFLDINSNKIKIGHYPSSAFGKGSENVNRIIKKLQDKFDFDYLYTDARVKWNKQMKRMSNVDIYIERMNMNKIEKGIQYKTGVWGITALEAAAMGKIVVTNFYGREKYLKEYGECGLLTANSENEMEQLLINLLTKSKEELLQIQKNTRLWVEKFHSFEAVGRRLRKIYENL